MNNEYFVFIDEDHGTVLLFSDLEKAQAEGWPEEDEWEQQTDDEWRRGEHCAIYRREADQYD
tara:strand:- start:106294 stop:106479 length:186 start_codon:yes stop_codon:yes gene_type:complete